MHLLESDLSRPVIEIEGFPSGELTHEMFAFGSEIAVVPVSGGSGEGGSPAWRLAAEELKREASRLTGISVLHAKFLPIHQQISSLMIRLLEQWLVQEATAFANWRKIWVRIKLNVKSSNRVTKSPSKKVEKESMRERETWKTGAVVQAASGNTPERSVKVEERANVDAVEFARVHDALIGRRPDE